MYPFVSRNKALVLSHLFRCNRARKGRECSFTFNTSLRKSNGAANKKSFYICKDKLGRRRILKKLVVERKRYLEIARDSLLEKDAALETAIDLQYLSIEELNEVSTSLKRSFTMLSS